MLTTKERLADYFFRTVIFGNARMWFTIGIGLFLTWASIKVFADNYPLGLWYAILASWALAFLPSILNELDTFLDDPDPGPRRWWQPDISRGSAPIEQGGTDDNQKDHDRIRSPKDRQRPGTSYRTGIYRQ